MRPHVYVDADACPVKTEVFKVAERHALQVTLVAGSFMRIPADPRIRLEVVTQGFDAAGIRQNFYSDPVENAEIMCLQLEGDRT